MSDDTSDHLCKGCHELYVIFSTLRIVIHYILTQNDEVGITTISICHVRKLRDRSYGAYVPCLGTTETHSSNSSFFVA